MGLFKKKEDSYISLIENKRFYKAYVGTVWFIDGHTENILSYAETCEGTIFYTESGMYKYMQPLTFYKYERMGDSVFCDSVYKLVEVPVTYIYNIDFKKAGDHEND